MYLIYFTCILLTIHVFDLLHLIFWIFFILLFIFIFISIIFSPCGNHEEIPIEPLIIQPRPSSWLQSKCTKWFNLTVRFAAADTRRKRYGRWGDHHRGTQHAGRLAGQLHAASDQPAAAFSHLVHASSLRHRKISGGQTVSPPGKCLTLILPGRHLAIDISSRNHRSRDIACLNVNVHFCFKRATSFSGSKTSEKLLKNKLFSTTERKKKPHKCRRRHTTVLCRMSF
jgi:hypothetical protein